MKISAINKYVFITLSFLVINLVAWSQITVNKTSGCAPLTQVQFSFPTTGIWNFDDGSSASGTSVTHTFSTADTYNVTFSQAGNVVDQVNIQVFGNPTPNFNLTGSAAGCIPFNTSFQDASTGSGGVAITSRNWAFGDGGGSTNTNPNYTFNLVGTFSVSLIVTDANGCDSSITKTNLITTSNSPTSSFTTTPNPASSCTAPLTVSFTNNSINSSGTTSNLTYLWDFGNGQTSSSASPPNVIYSTQGTFTVKLTVTQGGGCSHSSTKIVNIGNPKAIPNVSDTICLGATIVGLGNNSVGASSFVWNFTGGPTYNTKNPTHTFNTPGNQIIKLTANSSQGCSDDTTFTVFVEEIKADFSRNPSYLCSEPYCIGFTDKSSSSANKWNWTFGDNTTSTLKNPNHCYSINDTIYYVHDYYYKTTKLQVMSASGCSATISYTDTIYPVSAFFMPDVAQGCAPLSVAFSDSTRSREKIISWKYDFGDGTTSSSENPTHIFTNPGEYKVTLIATNSLGCKDTSYPVTIEVGKPLSLNFSVSPSSICIGDSVTFTDLSNDPLIDYWHYSTNNNMSSACVNQANQTWADFDKVGTQDVTLSANYNGCISSKTISNAITVKGPLGELSYSAKCKSSMNYDFVGKIQGATNWTWDFGDGVITTNSTDSTVSHTYATSGDYKVKLITINAGTGCANDTQLVTINVRKITAVISGDTILCNGVNYSFDGSKSSDVSNWCNDAYRWDLGNKTAPKLSSTPTTSFAFPDTGNYKVRLIVKDINNCRDTAFYDVRVNTISAKFSADKTKGCLPLAINLNDLSTSDTTITNWTWTSDGTTFSSSTNSSINYTTSGVKEIKLLVTDALGCSDIDSINISPIIPDTTFLATTKTNICVGESVKFATTKPNSLSNVTWYFGDTLGTSSSKTPNFVFNQAGQFNVHLSVTDTNGCTGKMTRKNYIYVEDYPIAKFSTNQDGNSVICYPSNISYSDISTGSILNFRTWDLGTNDPVIANPNVTLNYANPGTYTIELVVGTQNGCKDTVSRDIEIVGPIAKFTMSKELICTGESITFTITDSVDVETYLWDFGDGTTASEGSPVTHQYTFVPDSLSTLVQLITYSEDSVCDHSTKGTVKFHQLEARFAFEDSIICLNESMALLDSSIGANSYLWTISNGTSYNIANPPSSNFLTPGTYSVQLVVENNVVSCVDTLIKEIIVNPLPALSAKGGLYCFGDTVPLIAFGEAGLSYLWSPPDLIDNPTSNNTFALTLVNTNYTVSASDNNSCTNTAVAEIKIQNSFDPITIDTCVVIGETIPLGRNLGAGYTYLWEASSSDQQWLSCTTCAFQEIKVTEEVEEVNFTLYYTDTLGCFTNQMTYKVCILPSYTLDIPDAFTPDGDGVNDIIYLRGHGIEKVIEFKIFNRWGELVFESNDIHQGWDGIYKDSPQNMETYIYKAQVEFYNGKSETLGGTITLIR